MARAIKKAAKKPAPKKAAPKKKRVQPIPDKYPVVNVCLRVGHAAEALQYYCKAFGGKVRMRLDMPDGRIGHSEIAIGKGLIMVSDEYPEMNMVGPITVGSVCSTIQIYVKDVDATVDRAVKAGGKILRPARNEFYGDRSCTIEDPFGHVWMIQTHVEDVSKAEMKKRLVKLFGG
jgi:PhnB protein